MSRKPFDPLDCIPSPDAIREKLREIQTLTERLRLLLDFAERLRLPLRPAADIARSAIVEREGEAHE
jgi:hypothetical protein